MSEEPFVNEDQERDNAAAFEEGVPGAPREDEDNFLKSVGDAIKRGSEKAKKKAEESAPSLKAAVGKAAYGLSYGAAFGSSFGLTLVKEIIPGTLKEGGSKGYNAGKDAAKRAMTPKPKRAGSDGPVLDAEYTVS